MFLRSVSGRSVRELGEGPLPSDLSPYLAPPQAKDAVCGFFEQRGFQVCTDALGLTVSLTASASLFKEVFGATRETLSGVPPTATIVLPAPPEIGPLVEAVVLVPRPELFD